MNKFFLEKHQLEALIKYSLNKGVDHIEIYNSYKIKHNIVISNNKTENIFLENGISILFFINEQSFFISTTNFNIDHIKNLIKEKIKNNCNNRKKFNGLNNILIDGEDLPFDDFNYEQIEEDRVKYCNNKNDITNLRVILNSEKNIVIVANSEGKFIKKFEYHYKTDILMKVRIDKKLKFNYYTNGVSNTENLLKKINFTKEYNKLYTKIKKIKEKKSLTGYVPVVLSNGIGGIIMHESCGHSLESREILSNKSILNNIKKIDNNILTLVDDPTIKSLFGSYNFDDEGNKAEKKILIANGEIKNYLIDNYGQLKLNLKNNGSARKEGYYYNVTSRMSNTYIEPGKYSFNEIISTVDSGIYIKNIVGGVVDTISGDFSFNVLEGYLIIDGKIDYETCLDNLTVIGNTIDLINNISMIGNDLEYNCGICGSESGLIYTTVGQPTIKINKLFIGEF